MMLGKFSKKFGYSIYKNKSSFCNEMEISMFKDAKYVDVKVMFCLFIVKLSQVVIHILVFGC